MEVEPRGEADGDAGRRALLGRRVAQLGLATEVAIWVGVVVFYDRVWLGPNAANGNLRSWLGDVVAGRSAAPYQYRILAPRTIMWLTDHTGLGIERASLVLDVGALAVGVAAAHWMFVRLGLRWAAVGCSLYGAFLSLGLLWWGKPEAMAAFAGATVLAALLCTRADGLQWLLVGAGALVLAGSRTVLLAALAVGWVVRWWAGERRRADLLAGIGLGLLAVGATIGLQQAYPHARYPAGIGMVQLGHNLHVSALVILIAFTLPALGPLLVARTDRVAQRTLRAQRPLLAPVAAVVAAEGAFLAVFGRADEVRLIFPLTALLGLLAALGIQALRHGLHQPAEREPALERAGRSAEGR